jgi:hypothetical protein
VIGGSTAVVIDGYTRCATTFAVYAFQLSQPRPVPMAHHLHAPAQLIAAAQRGIPAIALIREPKGAVLSQLVREPYTDLGAALEAYTRFYRRLLPYRQDLVLGEFAAVTADFGAVVRALNRRFGTSFAAFVPTPEAVAAVNELVRLRPTLSPTLLSFESGTVTRDDLRAALVDGVPVDARGGAAGEAPGDTWLPSAEREARKAQLLEQWNSPALAAARRDALESYRRFCA